MGIIIITASEADTMVLTEVARRFGCKVDVRFGNYVFDDNTAGISKVMSATEPKPAERKSYQGGTEGLKEFTESLRGVKRFLKKNRR